MLILSCLADTQPFTEKAQIETFLLNSVFHE